jgi:hypothetical protein
MGVNPLSRKETHTLIACLLAAIEDPSNPPEEDERDQLITSSQRWLEMDEAQFKSYAEVGWQPGPDVDPGICQFEAVEGEPGYLHGRLRMDGVMFHLIALRGHETVDGIVEGHPCLNEQSQQRLAEFWVTDSEARFSAIEIPGFEGEYFVFMTPSDLGPFRILVTAVAVMYDDGAEDVTDIGWESGTTCTCISCKFASTVEGFQLPKGEPPSDPHGLIGFDVHAADGGDYGHRVLDHDADTHDYVVRPICWSTKELLYPDREPEALDDFKITYRYDLRRKEKSYE